MQPRKRSCGRTGTVLRSLRIIHDVRHKHLHRDAALGEIDFGAHEGRPLAELELEESAHLSLVATRVGAWLAGVEAGVPEGHLLVVAHGGPLRVLLCLLLGLQVERYWSFRLDCAGVSVVECAPGLATLTLLNDCGHLQGEGPG